MKLQDRVLQGSGDSRGRAKGANDYYLRGIACNNETSYENIIAGAYKDPGRNVHRSGRRREKEKLEGGSAMRVSAEELDAAKERAPG